MSTTWSGLGLSNPPPPLPNSASPSHFHSQQMSTPPLYSTLVSTSNQRSMPLTGPISSSSPQFSSTTDHGYYSPPPLSFPLPNHTFHPHHDYSSYRPPRVDLLHFNGEDVVGWLAMAERHIRLHRIPYHERVATVTSHFGPDASVWMNAFEIRHPIISWDQLVTALLEHFGSGTSTDFTAALSHLQHSSSVDDYISAFTKLSCRAPDWSEQQLLPVFFGGLKPEIRYDFMAIEPTSLATAQRLATRRFESKLNDLQLSCAPRPGHWNSPPPIWCSPSLPQLHATSSNTPFQTHIRPDSTIPTP